MDTFRFNLFYEAIKQGKTLLGVGPMSFFTIDATIEIANEYKIPLILIASRRQIECLELGTGYVSDTKIFSEYVREKDTGKYIALARDHGGPWQGTNEDDLDYFSALERSCISYYSDIKNGFNIIHLDPSLKSRPIEKIIDDIKFLYRECEKYAKDLEKEIVYEAGTEEHSGQINTIEQFEFFVKEVKRDCPKVKFVVGNTGLWVKEDRNVGKFDKEHTKELVEICNKRDVFLKAHNCDYFHNSLLNSCGVHASNIAPEMVVIETTTLLNQWLNKRRYKDFNIFIQIALQSGKWKKWLLDDSPERWNKQIEGLFKATVCGHYIFRDPEIKAMRDDFNIEQKCKEEIKKNILGTLNEFGWRI